MNFTSNFWALTRRRIDHVTYPYLFPLFPLLLTFGWENGRVPLLGRLQSCAVA